VFFAPQEWVIFPHFHKEWWVGVFIDTEFSNPVNLVLIEGELPIGSHKQDIRPNIAVDDSF
jgi:hypothetical protein